MDQSTAKDIIQSARDALKVSVETSAVPQESPNLPATTQVNLPTTDVQARPPLPASYQKFAGIPQQIRETSSVDVYEVKRLNLAATLEALERAADSYDGFPTPDGGFAVANLSEVVLKLTRDLERTQDPMILLNLIKQTVLQNYMEQTIYAVAVELKNLKKETLDLLPEDKQNAYGDSIKNTLSRISPAFTDAIAEAEEQLKKALNIKSKRETPT
jgi:hypothetical protein